MKHDGSKGGLHHNVQVAGMGKVSVDVLCFTRRDAEPLGVLRHLAGCRLPQACHEAQHFHVLCKVVVLCLQATDLLSRLRAGGGGRTDGPHVGESAQRVHPAAFGSKQSKNVL